jgi:hypothetical protein
MRPDQDLRQLDEAIASLSGSHDAAPWDHLLDRLRTARRYLLGASPGEYKFTLQQAVDSVACIPDKTARAEAKKMLRNLMDSEAPSEGRSTGQSGAPLLPRVAPAAATP